MLNSVFPAKKNKKRKSADSGTPNQIVTPLCTVLIVYLVDRLSKHLIQHFFSEGGGVPVIQNIFHLTRVNNSGAAFGLMQEKTSILVLATLVSVAVMAYYLNRHWEGLRFRDRQGWMLIIGGALGNLYDRVVYGHVVDFLDFRVWPVFNFADMAVCVGVALILMTYVTERS